MTHGTGGSTRRSILTAGLLMLLLAGCGRAGLDASNQSSFSVDGVQDDWTSNPGTAHAPADAQFHRHGMATGVLLRAHDGQRRIELFATFLGEPSEPVFLTRTATYDDGQGTLFERSAPRAAHDAESGIDWEHLELDFRDGTGSASVSLDVPVCVAIDSGPLEHETRCHRITGRFQSPLVRNTRLRVTR